MGQAVTCVALGVVPDKALWKEIRKKLQEKDGDWGEGLTREPNAESSMTDRMAVLGYVVALDGDADYKCPGARTDVPDLPLCASVDAVVTILGLKYVSLAQRQWNDFEAWAKKRGVKLPEPEFIVTQVEIA